MASPDPGPSHFDFETWQQRQEARAAEEEAQARAAITRLCGALRRLGIEQIELGYEGGHDTGAIESWDIVPDIEPSLPDAYRIAIEQAVVGLLPSGWDLNEGSSGRIVIDVDSGEAEVDHEWAPATDLGTLDDRDDA